MPESPEKKDKKEKKEKKKKNKWNLFGWNTKEEEEEVVETAIEKTQRELEETTNLYKDNITKIIDRNTHLEYLQENAEELEAAVQQQKSKARSLSWKGWMAKNKCVLITSGVIFFITLIITIIIINLVIQAMETAHFTSTKYRMKRGNPKKKLRLLGDYLDRYI
ncbi:synaptobrevin-domain-containing protein [Chytridium lagenaria]|nr:synaptobrevin-domain-containing protein [Chytridium lagenaria]